MWSPAEKQSGDITAGVCLKLHGHQAPRERPCLCRDAQSAISYECTGALIFKVVVGMRANDTNEIKWCGPVSS